MIGRFRFRLLLVIVIAIGAFPVHAANAFPIGDLRFPTLVTPEKVTSDAGPVFVSGQWRVTVIAQQRAAEFPEMELSKRTDREWIVVLVDAGNWSEADAELDPSSAHVLDPITNVEVTADRKRSAVAARSISVEPRASTKNVTAAPMAVQRMLFAFAVTPRTGPVIFAIDGEGVALAVVAPWPETLPSAGMLPPLPSLATQTQVATRSEIGLGAGLAGVDAPMPGECFGTQAAITLARADRDGVAVETDRETGQRYVWLSGPNGTPVLVNQLMLRRGEAGLAPGVKGPYAAWLTESARVAATAGTGLWALCDRVHGDLRPVAERLSVVSIAPAGERQPYAVWSEWTPVVVGKPDGTVWVFFSAEPANGPDAGLRQVYASRFDPATGQWSDAQAMPGGNVQMGVAAAAGPDGRVHVVFADRASSAAGDPSRIMYTVENLDGGWSDPVAIDPHPHAGFQLAPSIAVDRSGTVFVAWQDQRAFSAMERQREPAFADVYASELPVGGTWSTAIPVSGHQDGTAASRPNLAIDGIRLVVVWSTYRLEDGFERAARIDWSERTVTGTAWAKPRVIVQSMGDGLGGLLVDVSADPTRGVVLVYGRSARDTFLFMRRLEPGASEWSSDALIAFGDRGSYPTLAVDPQGDAYVVYSIGDSVNAEIGMVKVGAGESGPSTERVLTADQPNGQIRPGIGLDVGGRPFVVYFAGPAAGFRNQVRVIQYAQTAE